MQRPCLPDLKNLVEAEESSDEEGDEQHLLSILKKLKTAKSSIDTTKQRYLSTLPANLIMLD